MNTLQNLHQHTTFCDGKDTPEEVVLAAIDKGFGGIGFSSHCYMDYAKYYCMPLDKVDTYRAEIARLKEKYGHLIDIFCGIEFDICCPERPEGFDYVIGSIHGLRFDGIDYEFDGIAEHFQKMIDEHFAGMHPIHTINNMVAIVFALMLGGCDFEKCISECIAIGLDNDCTGATVGSIVGACLGIDGIPTHWYDRFNDTIMTYIIDHGKFSIEDAVDRFVELND